MAAQVGPPVLAKHAAQPAARITVRGVQVDRAAQHPHLVPAAFGPDLPLCTGDPCCEADPRHPGHEDRMQQLRIRLASKRVVAHAASKVLAG